MLRTLSMIGAALTLFGAACGWAFGAEGAATVHARPQETAAAPYLAPHRRRIYLMRHGNVAYFDAAGRPAQNEDVVVLSTGGRAEADAAGRYFRSLGIRKFDKVITSGLPRTVETAERVMAAIGQPGAPEPWLGFREISPWSAAQVPRAQLKAMVEVLTQAHVPPTAPLRGGEPVAELQARVYPALEKLRADPSWDTALLVLHGGVNSAILSQALTGGSDYLGHIEQGPGCINILDMGDSPQDWIVRAINLCPDGNDYRARASGLEKYAEYMTGVKR
ncbi:fructose-2,6-bisphosphatase [Pandoraea terrae]|uniref:Fructose-2,6-bisphosphatase n=1 Tax=Pandoraea terrae TaxID=1537710 RepID=A0A5E4XZ04_9BURK|nr:histidine phosphatase family protein [Pandoraea terrae]VVE41614.1 fructose-2,6-bisphosphatase [Pandoraea terrae]